MHGGGKNSLESGCFRSTASNSIRVKHHRSGKFLYVCSFRYIVTPSSLFFFDILGPGANDADRQRGGKGGNKGTESLYMT